MLNCFKKVAPALLCSLLWVTPVLAQELAVNGGFEAGNFSGWTNIGATNVANSVATPARSGTRSARLGNIVGITNLTQQFATVVGTTYIVSYWVAHVGANPANSLTVGVGPSVLTLTTLQTFNNLGAQAYTNSIFQYTATTTTTFLNFFATNTPGLSAGRYFLDDVSFRTPELDGTRSTLPLLTVGILLALGGSRRRQAV